MVGNSHQYRVSKHGQRFMASSTKSGNVYPRPALVGSQQPQPQAFPKQNQNPRFKGKKPKYNPNVTCTYCGKTGHVKLNCFRLINFPDDFQFTHDKGFNNQVKGNGDHIRGNGAMTMEETDNKQDFDIDISNQNYSQEQYNQFVKMFKHMKMEEGTNSGIKINANAVAGPFNEEASSFCEVLEVPHIPSPDSFFSNSPDFSPSPPNCPSPKTSLVTDSNLPTGSIPLRRSQSSTKGTLPIHLQDYFCNNIFISRATESYFATPITSTGISPTRISPSTI
ncbi:hypothetical protein H5410_032432 [Solanum commersonii]|uniref:CCHC-type domain-containing protein n=1 Tax=Solanum commersonii TaxID=4109 RepID=A0A9J5YQA3_SOLCO|nr:hypothetical protein H5410_032432 [Solanum commersonii]